MITPRPSGSTPGSISVVIPTHNTCRLTLACLDSLAASELQPQEIIVVDDGSTDGTAAAVAEAHSAVRVLSMGSSVGFTRAANQGLEACRGELLLLLNSDTEVAPDALGAMVTAFAAHPHLGVAGAALHYPDGSPQWSAGPKPGATWLFCLASGLPGLLRRALPGLLRRVLPISRRHPPGRGPQRVAWVTGAAMTIRRETWQDAGPLDERFAFYAQDVDFCLRASQLGWHVQVVPRCHVLHHHGATIGPSSNADGAPQDLGLLWSDLARWAAKSGPAAARRAVKALRWGGRLRYAALHLASLVGRERRQRLRGPLLQIRRALATLTAAATSRTEKNQHEPLAPVSKS